MLVGTAPLGAEIEVRCGKAVPMGWFDVPGHIFRPSSSSSGCSKGRSLSCSVGTGWVLPLASLPVLPCASRAQQAYLY